MTQSKSRSPFRRTTSADGAALPMATADVRRTIHDPQVPRTPEEAEAQYVAARTAWAKAMHAAASGRPADLATLAIAQEAYERAAMERARWEAGPKVAIPIESRDRQRGIEAAIGQELAWRKVRQVEDRPHGLKGLFGRFGGKR